MTETVTVPIEALRNCRCPSDFRATVGQCEDSGQCGCSIALKQRLGHPAQGVPDPAAQFVMWAMLEGSWQGADIDGGAAQDKAVALGLIVQTLYDPEKHGHDAHCEPGDTWFVPSETLLAALGTSAVPSTEEKSHV